MRKSKKKNLIQKERKAKENPERICENKVKKMG
jgi:hypothetical protein